MRFMLQVQGEHIHPLLSYFDYLARMYRGDRGKNVLSKRNERCHTLVPYNDNDYRD